MKPTARAEALARGRAPQRQQPSVRANEALPVNCDRDSPQATGRLRGGASLGILDMLQLGLLESVLRFRFRLMSF